MKKAALTVDASLCDGVGICALVAPDLVTLDRWGFPVIDAEADATLVRQAKRAAKACPHRAMRATAN
jgi:ferredoxin